MCCFNNVVLFPMILFGTCIGIGPQIAWHTNNNVQKTIREWKYWPKLLDGNLKWFLHGCVVEY